MRTFKFTFTDGTEKEYTVSHVRNPLELVKEVEEMNGKEVETWTEIN